MYMRFQLKSLVREGLSGLPSDVILLYYQIVRLDLIRSLPAA